MKKQILISGLCALLVVGMYAAQSVNAPEPEQLEVKEQQVTIEQKYANSLVRQRVLVTKLKGLQARLSECEQRKKMNALSPELLRGQLDLFNKAYEYIFYFGKRSNRQLQKIRQAFDALAARYADGAYVKELADLVHNFNSRTNRKVTIEGLLDVKDRVLADLNQTRKSEQKKSEERDEAAAKAAELAQKKREVMPQADLPAKAPEVKPSKPVEKPQEDDEDDE